ncbi:MAG: mitochondrial fission ELM1 family protein [Geminicoccaceae bacterium]
MRIWALVDTRPGNVSQVLGVAEALGLPFEPKPITYGSWAKLPNMLLGASNRGLTSEAKSELLPPWRDRGSGAGRRAAPVMRWLKSRTHGKTYTVQLMWPDVAQDLDLIVVPDHDVERRAKDLLRVTGSPHRVSAERIAAGLADLPDAMKAIPEPRIAVLIGGTSRTAAFTPSDAALLGLQVQRLSEDFGSGGIVATSSRRTGPVCEDSFAEAVRAPLYLHRFGTPGANPYPSMLGLADAIVVSADSASMLTEACVTGKPVYLFTPSAGRNRKLERLHNVLEGGNHVKPIDQRFTAPPVPLPNPAHAVAAAIRERLSLPEAAALEPAFA